MRLISVHGYADMGASVRAFYGTESNKKVCWLLNAEFTLDTDRCTALINAAGKLPVGVAAWCSDAWLCDRALALHELQH